MGQPEIHSTTNASQTGEKTNFYPQYGMIQAFCKKKKCCHKYKKKGRHCGGCPKK